jgi:flagellar protein FlgJ
MRALPAAHAHLPAAAQPAATAPAKMREAARGFETQALSQLLQPAFAGLGAEALGGGGAAEAQWRPMLVDALAAAATRAGHGLGLADAVLREMLRRQSADPAAPATTTPTTTTAEDATR